MILFCLNHRIVCFFRRSVLFTEDAMFARMFELPPPDFFADAVHVTKVDERCYNVRLFLKRFVDAESVQVPPEKAMCDVTLTTHACRCCSELNTTSRPASPWSAPRHAGQQNSACTCTTSGHL